VGPLKTLAPYHTYGINSEPDSGSNQFSEDNLSAYKSELLETLPEMRVLKGNEKEKL